MTSVYEYTIKVRQTSVDVRVTDKNKHKHMAREA